MGMSVPQCLGQLHICKGVVGLATGAGFIYLLYKAIKAGIKCQPPLCTTSPICIARECPGPGERALPQEAPTPEASSVGGPKGLAIERERHGRDSGELRRLLNSLECKQDEYAKSMILHSITRCVYLLEAEASACTTDDIALVGSMLDDKDNSVKIQALNTLKAFSGIRKFRLKVQVQAIRLLSYLAQKNDLLYDILNCQVHANFLNLFQSTQPGSLLFEVLVFAERLSEGRNSPHYRAVKWHYNEQSLHEALFGDESRLADRLLALVIHPEEEVQIQACKVIVSLQCSQDVGVRPSVCQPSRSYFNSGE
ncbi:armadillo repeat-containing protein 12 isoform X3 [Acinonyx jubatus]|uniref:Armadillo repeat-containing protein 12 isoform X3 n=1 Tax=Acinonyx jubatus TaxID=32536 RepID=A0ABM3Q4M8_ACIJB|nr:armadillo repeat-containing protein 12 isoform X3 [Acinonyx jubatus]